MDVAVALLRCDEIKYKISANQLGTERAIFLPKPPECRMDKQLPRNLDRFERLSSYGSAPRVRHNPHQILILYAERKRGLCGVAVPGYRQGVKLTGVVATWGPSGNYELSLRPIAIASCRLASLVGCLVVCSWIYIPQHCSCNATLSESDARSLHLPPSLAMILLSLPFSLSYAVLRARRSKSRLSLGLTNNALSDTALVLVRLLIIFGPALSAPA